MRAIIREIHRRRQGHSRGVRRRLGVALLAVGLSFGVGPFAAAPVASGAEAAVVDVSATAELPRFPCYWEHGPCTGVLQGGMGGVLSGDLPDGSWSVTLADAPLAGSFAYVHALDCTMSPGYGSLAVTAADGNGVVDGTIVSDSGEVREVDGLAFEADFSWQQVGFAVDAFLANGAVSLHVAGEGWTEAASGLWGTGATSYVPDLPADDPFDCSWMTADDTAPPADVLMTGSIALSDA